MRRVSFLQRSGIPCRILVVLFRSSFFVFIQHFFDRSFFGFDLIQLLVNFDWDRLLERILAPAVYLCALPDVVYPFLLADLGTNGEFVLAVDHKTFVAASVPIGRPLRVLDCAAEPGRPVRALGLDSS